MSKTDNELIAEFMGFIKDEDTPWWSGFDRTIYDHSPSHHAEQLRFHESWEWLMPVVWKIEKLTPKLKIPDDLQALKENRHPIDKYMEVTALPLGTPIAEAYKAVVEFIKWYNSQPKEV